MRRALTATSDVLVTRWPGVAALSYRQRLQLAGGHGDRGQQDSLATCDLLRDNWVGRLEAVDGPLQTHPTEDRLLGQTDNTWGDADAGAHFRLFPLPAAGGRN